MPCPWPFWGQSAPTPYVEAAPAQPLPPQLRQNIPREASATPLRSAKTPPPKAAEYKRCFTDSVSHVEVCAHLYTRLCTAVPLSQQTVPPRALESSGCAPQQRPIPPTLEAALQQLRLMRQTHCETASPEPECMASQLIYVQLPRHCSRLAMFRGRYPARKNQPLPLPARSMSSEGLQPSAHDVRVHALEMKTIRPTGSGANVPPIKATAELGRVRNAARCADLVLE
ncbi:hypothetical protein CGC20_14870 [Leishmania donovani]|uniref:Uncharacterized protein n=1 Tax=Leishmania donovani TaxID=5661 RepID=A0A504X8C0_LEIDO|nr:hypothetical protein CGC21_7330 [Leishmania donovani]TPP47960.1 hypothetical protein CGC20_14870 [Leishmania donovani]